MAAVTVKTLYSFYYMILDSCCNLNSQSKSDVNQKGIAVPSLPAFGANYMSCN